MDATRSTLVLLGVAFLGIFTLVLVVANAGSSEESERVEAISPRAQMVADDCDVPYDSVERITGGRGYGTIVVIYRTSKGDAIWSDEGQWGYVYCPDHPLVERLAEDWGW